MKHPFSVLSKIIVLFILVSCMPSRPKLVKFQGQTQGTYYIITYYDAAGRIFQKETDSLLHVFDMVASMWIDSSLISRVNRNETTNVDDPDFTALFNQSEHIYLKSDGAFDPTVGPLVNAWGFGFTDRLKIDQEIIDSLMPFIGFNKVKIENEQVVKQDPRIQFDFNAIAQGYSVDLVGKMLEKNGIADYLIDIGGEVMGKGHKPGNESWKVGIEKPEDNAEYGQGLEAIVKLNNKAMATSGSYRKFYEMDGVRYSHTIDPKTGYPVQHSLLSVSVIADDCATADGWATAFMVMGLDKSIEILARDKSLDAYFIYSGASSGDLRTYFTEGFNDILVSEEEQ